MNQQLIIDQEERNFSGVIINREATKSLQTAGNWGLFLSILGFVFIAIMLIASITTGVLFMTYGKINTSSPQNFNLVLSITYFVLCLLYFFPTLFLFRFSRSAKSAVKDNMASSVESAFANFRYLMVFMGIIIIVSIALGLVAFIVATAISANNRF